MLQIAETRDCTNNMNRILHCKCLHISASVQHFNHACSERLRCCISILVSARKGLSLLWCLSTQGSLVQRQFLSLVIYRLPRRTSRGTPPTIYPVNTQPLAFSLFCTRKNLCKCLAKQDTRQAAHLPLLETSTLQSFHQNDFFLFVSPVCVSFYPLYPPCFLFLSSERVEEIPWYITVRNM